MFGLIVGLHLDSVLVYYVDSSKSI